MTQERVASALRSLKQYGTAYYAFFAGVGVGIPIGSLACAYAIRLLLNGLT